mmetsp:Transcript_92082/g.269432  ORF Transcript_92082/g.269432 Transcript_92082/m.269432 type:complete len:206 (-) Transcript_92082:156-773(-)
MIRTSSRGTINASGIRRTSSSATRRKAAAAGCQAAANCQGVAAMKEAAAAALAQEPCLRPSSRGATTRRRPAPKAITECALKGGSIAIRPTSAGSVHGAWEAPAGARSAQHGAACVADASTGASHCTISMDGDVSAEIRTKVFRMGAPLLRSTIPLSLGEHAHRGSHVPNVGKDDDVEDGEETVLSVSDGEDELAGLSVTLDFPC